jgi:hypothetical protein
MRGTETPGSISPHLSAPPPNRVKSILEYLDPIAPQGPSMAPQRPSISPQERDSSEALPRTTVHNHEAPSQELGSQRELAAVEGFALPREEETPANCLPIKDAKALSDAEFLAEARRIARELVKLYHAGVITGPDDPEAIFCACLIRDFGGTVLLRATWGADSDPDGNPAPGVFVPGKPYTPTEEQRVRVPYGLTREEQRKFLQDDLDSLND